MSPSEPRPFWFWMVLWGEDFRSKFLDTCLPSLLAPGNLPAIAARRPANFVIATTAADWQAMNSTAIFAELKRHVTPIKLELPSASPDRPSWQRAVDGKKLCCEFLFAKKAYAIFINPDHLYADGSMRRLDELAQQGVEFVSNDAITSVEDAPFLRLLAESGLARRDGDIAPIAIAPRQLVGLAVRSMHRMWLALGWEAPYYWGLSPYAWWRVAGDQGMVGFCLGTEPTLCDYAAVRDHDSAVLDERGADGDYAVRNFADCTRFYCIRDSDEFYSVALDPPSYNVPPLLRQLLGGLSKGAEFRALCTGATGVKWNWMQKTKLFAPTRVHTEPIDEEKWQAAEKRALRILLRWVDPDGPLAKLGSSLPPALTGYASVDAQINEIRRQYRLERTIWRACTLGTLVFRLQRSFGVARALQRRLVLASRGDRAALRWWSWALRKRMSRYLGLSFSEPRPEVQDRD